MDEVRGETFNFLNSVCFVNDYNKVCLVQHGAVLSCIFVLETLTKGFTAVYSDNLNKVIWTLLKIAQVFIQTFFFLYKGQNSQKNISKGAHLYNGTNIDLHHMCTTKRYG